MDEHFDPDKDALNRDKHSLPLLFGERVFEDPAHLVIPSIRPIDGEERFKAIGTVEGRLYTAVFTWRGERRRYISVRRSNPGEDRLYRSAG